ncbi:hypothetical protein [Staphylococcus auricularis]|uniref:hypothetical protein n=1 Tax=Staphylococcus auricularis TaxID=29379 RepID=UPI002430E170|nr:hypothetical protein [Staphylococcus auricularis]
MIEDNKNSDKLNQTNHENSEANEPEKSEIEAELLQYLEDREQNGPEEKPEKKKYKTLIFIAPLVLAIIYIYKYILHVI